MRIIRPHTSKLFVWDFHGCLEKGNEGAVIETTNQVLAIKGYTVRLAEEDCMDLYGKKWSDYFAHLFPYKDPEFHQEMEDTCVSLSMADRGIIKRHIQPNDHADYVLGEIGKDHYQILLSNTEPESLGFFLECVGLEHHFSDAQRFPVNDGSGKTKEEILEDFISGESFSRAINIGDSPKDIELTGVLRRKDIDVATFLYAHPGKPFRNGNVDYPVEKIRDLRAVLE